MISNQIIGPCIISLDTTLNPYAKRCMVMVLFFEIGCTLRHNNYTMTRVSRALYPTQKHLQWSYLPDVPPTTQVVHVDELTTTTTLLDLWHSLSISDGMIGVSLMGPANILYQFIMDSHSGPRPTLRTHNDQFGDTSKYNIILIILNYLENKTYLYTLASLNTTCNIFPIYVAIQYLFNF